MPHRRSSAQGPSSSSVSIAADRLARSAELIIMRANSLTRWLAGLVDMCVSAAGALVDVGLSYVTGSVLIIRGGVGPFTV